MKTTTPKKYLWKFLLNDMKSQAGNHQWELKKWYHEDKVEKCKASFHASENILDALSYVKGTYLCKVEVKGVVDKEDDKECWSDMRVVKAYKWTQRESVQLAIYSAELVLENFEKVYPKDKRPREAIEAAKKWLKGEITKEELENAADSAADSASYSARYAAYFAAGSAADSASYSAYFAAYSAYFIRSAYSAARSAARSAYFTRSAARSAAADSAAAEDIFKKIHNHIVKELIPTMEEVK